MGDRYWLFNVWFAYRGNGSDLADNAKETVILSSLLMVAVAVAVSVKLVESAGSKGV